MAVEQRTSHPVVLNTSFNVMGKPIVESPREALLCFVTSEIDHLFLGNFVVSKELIGRAVPSLATGHEPRPAV